MNPNKEEALLPTNHHSVRLPSFQGPLDLLLFLIKKNEIDIYDIPIENVTRQYLETLNKLEKINLELTGEFFVMAATLMLIKSRMLLPKPILPDNEEEQAQEDPRWELVQQLIEYKKLKEQSLTLQSLVSTTNDLLSRNIQDNLAQKEKRPLKITNSIELWNAFNKVIQQLSSKIVTGNIHEEPISVTEQMNFILNTLSHHPQFFFSSLFQGKNIPLNTLIATFLAILELSRLRKLLLQQTENFDDILCTAPKLN